MLRPRLWLAIFAFAAHAAAQAPILGMIDLDRTPSPGLVASTGTPVDASDRPQIVLRTATPRVVRLSAHGASVAVDSHDAGTGDVSFVVLQAGDHPVWVRPQPFHLEIRSEPLAESPGGARLRAREGTYELAPNGGSRTFSGTVQGALAASAFSTACDGYVPRDPLVTLRARAPMHVQVDMLPPHVESGEPPPTDIPVLAPGSPNHAVLLIRTGDGNWACSQGDAERITLDVPAGVHQLWVGSAHLDEMGRFEVRVSGAGVRAPPLFGELAIGHAGVERAYHGSLWAPAEGGNDIASRWPAAILIHLTEPTDIAIELRCNARAYAVARDSSGAYDDVGSDLQRWSPGDHLVFVRRRADGPPEPFTLQVHARASGLVLFAPP